DHMRARERLGVLDEDDASLVRRSEESLGLPGDDDLVRIRAARIDTDESKRGRRLCELARREVTARRRRASEERADQLTRAEPDTERVLAVEQVERSRGCGRRGLRPKCRLQPPGFMGGGRWYPRQGPRGPPPGVTMSVSWPDRSGSPPGA